MAALNNTQLEILNLFRSEKSEEELLAIKKLISDYLFNKAINLPTKCMMKKAITRKILKNGNTNTYGQIGINEGSY